MNNDMNTYNNNESPSRAEGLSGMSNQLYSQIGFDPWDGLMLQSGMDICHQLQLYVLQ